MSQQQVESEEVLRLAELICDNEEKTVLTLMRDDCGFAEEVKDELNQDCFYDPMRSLLFRAMVTIAVTSEPYEIQMIAMQANRIARDENLKLTMTAEYIRSLAGPTERARSFKGLLKERAEKRKLYKTFEYGLRNINTMSSYELAIETRKRIDAETPKSKGERVVYGAMTQPFLKDELHKDAVRKARGYKKPLYPWDVWNRYVLPPDSGKITLFGAMDGVGKSSYAHRIAEGWAKQGLQVCFVHAEDPLKKILKRRICHYSEVYLDRIEVEEDMLTDEIYFTAPTQQERNALAEADRRIASWVPNLHYVNMIGGTIHDAIYELESMRKDARCDLVMVDYIGAFAAARSQAKMEKHQRVVDEASHLTIFSGSKDVPVFALAQGTKKMADSGDDIAREDLYGGAQLYQQSNTVVLFSRKKMVEGSEVKDKHGRIIASGKSYSPMTKIIVDKQNDGDTNAFNQFFEGRFFSIHDKQFW